MARYTTSLHSPLNPATAFDSLADFTTVAAWDPGVTRSVRVDAGDLAIGSAFDVDVALGGRSVTFRYEIMELEQPSRVVLRARRGPFTSLDTITVRSADGGGCTVTYDAVLELRGALRIADPLLAVGFRRVGDAAAAGLQTHLDGALAA